MSLEKRLLAARDDLRARAGAVTALHAARVAAARAYRVDPSAAGAALEGIAKTKSYRIGGHRTFAAFARAELGMGRTTAHRLRGLARADAPEGREAAAALGRWLRAKGIRSARVSATDHRRSARVTVVLAAADVARLLRVR